MKKFFAPVLAIALCVSMFSGCAGSTTGGSTVSTSTDSTVTKKPITLSYITWSYSDRTKSTDAFIKAVKEKYNITIEMQNVPTDQYTAVLKTKVASSDMPDLVCLHSMSDDYVADQIPFTENSFLDLSSLKEISNYSPKVLDGVKEKGKILYVPVSISALGAMYNKDVFSKVGITSMPTNLSEFTADLDKIKAKGITPIAAGEKDSWTSQMIPKIAFSQYIDSKDQTIAQKLGTGKLKYADIAVDFTKVLNVQQDWNKKGYFQENCLGTSIDVACQLVATGKAGMLINGTWEYSAINKANPNTEIGFFAVPLNNAGEKIQLPASAEEGIAINAGSPNLDAAKQALDYYLSAENQTLVMDDLNGISTNSQVKSSSKFVQEVQSVLKQSDINVPAINIGWNDGLYYPVSTTFVFTNQCQALLANTTTTSKLISDFDSANAKALAKSK